MNKKRGLTVAGVGLVVALGGGTMVWLQLQAPATATIRQLKPTAAVVKSVRPETPQTITDSDAIFEMPAGYENAASDTTGASHTYLFARAGGLSGSSSRLAVTIEPVDGSYTNVSAYQMRVLHPELYHHNEWSVGRLHLSGFIKSNTTDGYEAVVFWPENGLLATLAVSSDSTSGADRLATELQQLLAAWRWQK